MPRMNHVNLGVPVGGKPDMIRYLTEVLGFVPAEMSDVMRERGASWYEGEDGVQVHLSEDPDHRPAARAHVAVDFGDELDVIVARLRDAGIATEQPSVNVGFEIVNCCDPAGNRWELRGRQTATA